MKVRVTATVLNVRAEPGTRARVAGKVTAGTILDVVAEDRPEVDGYTWLPIVAGALAGWVAAAYTAEISDKAFAFAAWPTEFKVITQKYGARPGYYAQFGLPGHEGLDMRAGRGTRIFAVQAGRVKMVATDPRPKSQGGHNYGVHLRISHPGYADGDYETVYAHLLELLVEVGQEVEAGQLIGLADSTGNSSANHLHLTLKLNGKIIDPTPFAVPLMEES